MPNKETKTYQIDVDGEIIEVEKPNRQHLEAFFQRSARNIMSANRNLLIDIAVNTEEIKKRLDEDPILAMSISGGLSELVEIKESFLVKS